MNILRFLRFIYILSRYVIIIVYLISRLKFDSILTQVSVNLRVFFPYKIRSLSVARTHNKYRGG